MTSKERVKSAVCQKKPDRVPADFSAGIAVREGLKKKYGYENGEQILERFEIDFREVYPAYIGPALKKYDSCGRRIRSSYYGYYELMVWNGYDHDYVPYYYPFNDFDSIQQVDNYQWPEPAWFDYESIKQQCEKHKDRAIVTGDAGVYQFGSFMREMDKLFVDMVIEPDFAQRIFDRFVEFELEHYSNVFKAADGQIDILRIYDDFGTQNNMLFSPEMWRIFFKSNLSKLADLAHKNGAFLMLHSCGAIRPIIPDLVDCKVDILDPVQKVAGLEPEGLIKDFGGKITFHGGIDTQNLLPNGNEEEVAKEVKHFIDVLGKNGGYILAPSQAFQNDVPLENIEALYKAKAKY